MMVKRLIHGSHFSRSVGLFGAEQLLRTGFWERLQKNDTVEVASEKKGFLLALTKTRSQWLKFWLVAEMYVNNNFIHLFRNAS